MQEQRQGKHAGDGIRVTAAELIALRPRCHALMLPMHRPAASALAGAYRSRFRGRGVDFVESRNYQPGDDIRNMDWRVTARTGRAHTKVFQEERERPVLIVLDVSPSLFFGTRTRLKSAAAAHLAAAIAWTAVKRGDRVGAFLFSGGRHLELRPAGGRRGAMRVVQALTEWLDPVQGNAPAFRDEPGHSQRLAPALERVRHALRPGSLVLVVSDFFGFDAECHRHLSRLRQHNDVIGCQVLDPAEENLPPGRFPITDGREQSVLDTHREADRKRFESMSLGHLQEPQRAFLKHQCGWLALRTDDDPVDVLSRDLRVLLGRTG